MTVVDATLVGYYQLFDVNVPVFDHTRDVWQELVSAKLAGSKLATRSPRDLFGDLPVPRPTTSDVEAVVKYLSATGSEPPFIQVTATFSMVTLARQLLDGAAMTEWDKIAWKRTAYESSLARNVYPSFSHFDEALNQEVLALSGHVPVTANPETPAGRPGAPPGRPTLGTDPGRLLPPLLKATAAAGRALLVNAGEADYAAILGYLPDVQWTSRPVRPYAVWVPRISARPRAPRSSAST